MLRVSRHTIDLAYVLSDVIHRDNAFGRIFATEMPDNQNVTIESCIETCSGQNLTVAGIEYSGMMSPPTMNFADTSAFR